MPHSCNTIIIIINAEGVSAVQQWTGHGEDADANDDDDNNDDFDNEFIMKENN